MSASQKLQSIAYYALLISTASSFMSETCQFTLKDSHNVSSEYDLRDLYFTGKGHTKIHEVDDETDPDFSYLFNVCGSIPEPLFVSNTTIPSYCTGSDKGPCIKFKDYQNGTVVCSEVYPDTSTVTVPSAVQIKSTSTEKSCYWLGLELSDQFVNTTRYPNRRVGLVDKDNSGAGIVLTLLNGQFCPNGHNMNRELSIHLKCPDSTKTEWDAELAKVITEAVTEYSTCVYKVEFETPLGCPTKCITKHSSSSYAICSTHGICAADPNAGHSRCICDEGYGGDDCDVLMSGVDVIDAGSHDLITALVICIVITAICCGVAVYLWAVWRRSVKMNKMMDTEEYFLGIDEDIEEDEDAINAAMKQKKTRDTFHPVLSTDAETAKMIQIEHEKHRSGDSSEKNKGTYVNEDDVDP
eukprot:67136_1